MRNGVPNAEDRIDYQGVCLSFAPPFAQYFQKENGNDTRKRKFKHKTISRGPKQKRKEEIKHPPLDEIPPPRLSLRTLHPVLIYLDKLVVRRFREFGKSLHRVLQDLVVVSIVAGGQLGCFV